MAEVVAARSGYGRRKRATALLLTVPALVIGLGVGVAQAQVRNCEFQNPGLAFNDGDPQAPPFIAWGQRAHFETYVAETPGVVTVAAADPARPIAHPWQGQQNESFAQITVQTAEGDGPIRVTVEWMDAERSGTCRRFDERTIETGPGKPPAFKASVEGPLGLFRFPGGDCRLYETGRIQVAISGPGGRESVSSAGFCDPRYDRNGNSKRFHLTMNRDGAVFRPFRRHRTNKDWRFQFKIVYRGRVVKRGRIKVNNFYRAPRRIYGYHADGRLNDAYWNYCVNNGKQVWMEDGNPYCWTNGRRDQRTVVYAVRNY